MEKNSFIVKLMGDPLVCCYSDKANDQLTRAITLKRCLLMASSGWDNSTRHLLTNAFSDVQLPVLSN